MIIGLEGNLGAGKTVGMVYLGLILKEDLDIHTVSNISVEYSNQKVKGVRELNNVSNQFEGQMLLDEVWAWADSRKSNQNDAITQLVIYSRKRGWIVIYTTQSLHQVDKRLRENTDIVIRCSHTSHPEQDVARLQLFDMNELKHIRTITYNPEPIYSMYDTKEEVEVKDKSTKLEPIVDDIQELFKEDKFETKKEAKAYINMNYSCSQNDADTVVTEAKRRLKDGN